MSDDTPLLDADVVAAFPEYKVKVPRLGEGTFKAAYLASDSQQDFVLKILFGQTTSSDEEPALDARFIREIQLMAGLDTLRVASLYKPVSYREVSGSTVAWYGEPYYSDGSLDSILNDRTLSPSEAWRLTMHLFEGLEALHSQGIIHRDIKPGNICRTADGDYVILDLGIAHVVSMERLTETGFQSPMTISYSAPEQLAISRNSLVDGRTDIFAAGIVLFEVISGRHPFVDSPRMSIDDYLARIDNHVPGQLLDYDCHPTLQEVIDRCLASRQNRRFRNASQALAKLKEVETTT